MDAIRCCSKVSASDQWVSNTVSGGDTVKVQLDKDLTVAGKKDLTVGRKMILPAVTPDVLCDGICDISSKTKLEIVANRKEQGGISIPPHNGGGGKKAEVVKLPKFRGKEREGGRRERDERDGKTKEPTRWS